MKIVHLETSLEWRGGQQQIAYLMRGLVKTGIETILVCRPDSEIFRYFKKHRMPVWAEEIGHGWSLFKAHRVARFMKERGFTILHAHSAHALSLGVLIKILFPEVKLVASRRVDFHVKKPIIGAFKYSNPLIDRIICISQNIARVMQSDGVPAEKLTVIHSGVDIRCPEITEGSALKQELRIPKDHLVVGTVAALVGHKDYPTLLRAARNVIQKNEHVTFVAVGDGGDLEKLKVLHDKLRLGERFRFMGFRPDVQRYLNLFDVFVLSSQKEGLGTSVLDALACGLPVVATRAGGIPEMVQDGQNGLLVTPRNPEALAGALERILKDAHLRTRLGQNARRSVQAFSYETMVHKHLELYREISEGDNES